jgi:hypothetical protein
VGRHYLRLHILERVPGTFAEVQAEPAEMPGAFAGPSLEILHPESEMEPASA